MTDNQRNIKRLIIIAVYIAIIVLIYIGFYYLLRKTPTCMDKIRNQGEEGVDCGGPCEKCETIPKIENIVTLEKAVIPSGSGNFDALVRIKNPNSLYGIAELDYSFDFMGSDGKIAERKEGTSFILPAQTKYIIVFNIPASQKPDSFTFRIKSFRWQTFSDYVAPEVAVYGKALSLPDGEGGTAQLKAKIQNRSNYDFKKITTEVVLRNSKGLPAAVNQTDNNDVRVNEEREIIFNWSTALPKDIDLENIEIEPEVDVFSNDNFMKKFGSPQQYQSYGIENKE